MEKIGIGRTAEVYRNDDGNAVKLYYDWVPHSQVMYEAKVSQKISQLCRQAPEFFGTYSLEGRTGLCFELIDGEMVAAAMERNLLKIIKFARAIGRAHREIHAASAPDLRSSVNVYGEGLRKYDGLSADVCNKLMAFLQAQQGNSLCHGDFHPENILIDKNGQIRVIDWVNAYSGNPLSDVARTYYLLRSGISPYKKPLLVQAAERLLKPMIAKAYLKS